MQKPIVRNMIFGQPVIIGARPKPSPVEEEPEEEDTDKEQEEEAEEPKGLPQEILDKVFEEIKEIEQNKKLTEETLREAHKEKVVTSMLRTLPLR